MENGHFDHFSNVGAIATGTRIGWVSGKTNLVVENDVDRTAGVVASEPAQIQRFLYHALPRKGSVTVYHDG